MKNKNLHIRMTQRRYETLKAYAESKEKSVTQLIEDWVDRLPKLKIDDSDARGLANATLSSTSLPNQSND
jgi:hypothetical protein